MFRSGSQRRGDPGDPGVVASDAVEREYRVMLERWRLSEQRVWSSWKAWVAADAHESGPCYRHLIRALAEEEKAAAAFELLARMVSANRSASA